jgi:hypothetical protein
MFSVASGTLFTNIYIASHGMDSEIWGLYIVEFGRPYGNRTCGPLMKSPQAIVAWRRSGNILVFRCIATSNGLAGCGKTMLVRENFECLHMWHNRRPFPPDAQKDRPLRTSFVKRRSSLVAEPAAACSRDTLHDSRLTGIERARPVSKGCPPPRVWLRSGDRGSAWGSSLTSDEKTAHTKSRVAHVGRG